MKASFKSSETYTRDKTILEKGKSTEPVESGLKEKNKKESSLSIICWNLIPFAVAAGTYFLVYIFLPGVGYLHIFYSFLMALGVLGVLEGVISGLPVKRDLSMYVVMLVFILAGFTAINYQYSSVSPTPDQQTTSAPVSASAPTPVYGPGVYRFSLGPGESSISVTVSGDYHYTVMADTNDYTIIANGSSYKASKKTIIPWADRTKLRFINNSKFNNITLIIKR